MEVRIVKQNGGAGFLSKVTGILFGVFITSVIFAFSIRILEEIGIYVGLGISVILIIIGFLKSKAKTTLRMIIWGMAATIVGGAILYIVGLMMISNILQGL